MKTQADILNDAADLIEKGWTQKNFAKNAKGMAVAAVDPTACKFCLVGAIDRALEDAGRHEYWPGLYGAVSQAIKAKTDSWLNLTDYNDAKDRKKEEVVAALREAAKIAAKSQQSSVTDGEDQAKPSAA